MDVQKSEELAEALDSSIRNCSFIEVAGGRYQLSMSAFEIAHEHHWSIARLIADDLYGSAFTLARPIYEAYVHGVWLRACAVEDQLQKIIAGTFTPSLASMVTDIKKKDKRLGNTLEEIRTRHGKVFDSFIHTGFESIVRRITQDRIEPNYKEEEIQDLLKFSDALAILAAFQIAIIADGSNLAQELEKTVGRYFGDRQEKPPGGTNLQGAAP